VPAAAVASTDPVQILRQMCDRLAQATAISFKATRQLDAALTGDGTTPESSDVAVAISRPNKIQATATSRSGVRRFYADGERISLLDETIQVYATVPLSGSIDDVLDKLDQTYGFVPPLADFAANDPYRRFSDQIQRSIYAGKETVNGVACDRVATTGETADATVWVSTADHLPRRFVATFKDREGTPKLAIDFLEWNLAATLPPSLFVFNASEGAQLIRMIAVDDPTPAGPTNNATPQKAAGSAK